MADRREGHGEQKTGYCVNCDNKHGCKSKTPPCLMEMRKDGVEKESGKGYLIQTGRTGTCRDCPFFRSCWNSEEYEQVNDPTITS